MRGKAFVVGAGIGGLAVAASLAQRGWKVDVHERAGELREVGAGIYLKENGIRVLERLLCLEPILRRSTRIKTSEIRDRHGRAILSRNVGNERVYTVLREDLHRELATAATGFGVNIELKSRIEHVSIDGRLTTADGQTHQGDLIVGADGLGSIVREQVGLQVQAERMANGSTRILVPLAEGDPRDGSVEYWRGHKRVMVCPVGNNITYFCASSREDDPRGVALPFDIPYWSECFPELERLFSRVTPEMGVHHAHGQVRVSAWKIGRVGILGDAVHGQPPNLGQGAGMAISNGYALVDCLDREKSVEAALTSWELANRRITEQVQTWSISWDHFVHRWPLPIEGLRSSVIWSLSNFPATRRHWGRLYRGLTDSELAAPVTQAAQRPT